MGIFIRLHAGEEHAEQNGEEQAPFQTVAVVFKHGMMRPGHGCARQQQQQSVDERQMPGIEHFDALGGPMTAGKFNAQELLDLAGIDAGVEKGPEPRHEEHHFRGNEHDHAVAVMQLHHAGVMALIFGLVHHIAPPRQHGVENADKAGAKHHRTGVQATHCHGFHPHDPAQGSHKSADRADQGPWARVDKVVVVVVAMCAAHGFLLRIICLNAPLRAPSHPLLYSFGAGCATMSLAAANGFSVRFEAKNV